MSFHQYNYIINKIKSFDPSIKTYELSTSVLESTYIDIIKIDNQVYMEVLSNLDDNIRNDEFKYNIHRRNDCIRYINKINKSKYEDKNIKRYKIAIIEDLKKTFEFNLSRL